MIEMKTLSAPRTQRLSEFYIAHIDHPGTSRDNNRGKNQGWRAR